MARKGDERRQAIIDTARRVLIEHGPDAFVLRDIAEQLGITHGNLQYYFPTKNALLVAIFDQELEKYTAGMKSAIAATSTRQGRLGAIMDSGIEELKSPATPLWLTMWSMSWHSPDMAAILKKENDAYQAVVVRELKNIAPRLSLKRRRHIARIIQAILDGLGVQLIYSDPNDPEIRALQSEIKAAVLALVEAE